MKRIVFIPFIVSVSFIFNISAQSDSAVHSSPLLPDAVFFHNVYANPAAYFRMPNPNQGKMEAAYSYDNYNNYHLLREGNSRSLFNLTAEGFTVKGKNAYWGKAAYRNKRVPDVQWTESVDIPVIGVGIIADSIGGTSYGESYNLTGGFARNAGRINWGLEAGFTGGHDYRKHDPRPKTTVSTLFAKAGAGIDFCQYQAGFSLTAEKYQQALSTSIEGPNRKDFFYVFRGFARIDYAESVSNSSFSWLYEGSGYGASVFLLPQHNTGWLLNAGYLYRNIDSYTSTKYPFSFAVRQTSLQTGYQHKTGKTSSQIKLEGQYETGKATERVYEYIPINETYYEYRLLSESKKYTRNRMHWNLAGLHEWFLPGSSRWLGFNAGYNRYEEKFNSPAEGISYRIDYRHLPLSVKGGTEIFTRKDNKSSVWMEAILSYTPLLDSDEIIPANDAIFDRAMKPDLVIRSSAPWGVNVKAQYHFPVYQRTKMFISLQAGGLVDGNYNRYSGELAVGFRY